MTETTVEAVKEETKAAKSDDKQEPALQEPALQEKDGPVVDGKMAEFIDWIEGITVLELSHLVKALEDRLGVSAAAPVAIVAGVTAGEAGGGEKPEEKTEFTVVLTAYGDQKIAVIKEVRAITGLGLKDSKDLVEGAPKPIKEGVSKEQSEEIKSKFEAVGASVEIK